MLQATQTSLDRVKIKDSLSGEIKVIMPNGLFGFEGVQHYKLTPLFPEKEAFVYWRFMASDFQDRVITPEERLCPKPGTVSFVLMALEGLKIGDIEIPSSELESALKPLGIRLDESVIFLLVSIETDEEGKLMNMTVNVKAPLVYHPLTHQAWQIILTEGNYPISLPLMAG